MNDPRHDGSAIMWHGISVIKRKLFISTLAAVAAVALLAGCGQAPAPQFPSGTPLAEQTTRQGAQVGFTDCQYVVSGTAAVPVDPPSPTDVPATGTTTVTLSFAGGPVTLTLDRARTPCTVNSFVSLADQGYFTGTKCHRLTDAGIWVLQCGDPTETGRGGPGYSFADETYADDTFPAGTVAMANAGPDTNGSQFFFVYADSPLPPNYTVFGQLDAASLGVIQQIAAAGLVPASPDRPNDGTPVLDTTIERVTVG